MPIRQEKERECKMCAAYRGHTLREPLIQQHEPTTNKAKHSNRPSLDILFLEFGKEPFPVFLFQERVFRQFSLDHELLNVINGVNIFHTVHNNLAELFQPLEGSHRRDRVSLNQHVASRQQFDRFQRGAFGSYQSLTAFHETFLVSHQSPNFDDFAVHVVVQNFDSLCDWDGPREKFDHIPGFDNDERVRGFPSREDGHGTLNQVQLARDLVFFKRL